MALGSKNGFVRYWGARSLGCAPVCNRHLCKELRFAPGVVSASQNGFVSKYGFQGVAHRVLLARTVRFRCRARTGKPPVAPCSILWARTAAVARGVSVIPVGSSWRARHVTAGGSDQRVLSRMPRFCRSQAPGKAGAARAAPGWSGRTDCRPLPISPVRANPGSRRVVVRRSLQGLHGRALMVASGLT